jgi:predicted DNA-binding protein with PD1-like motif
MFVDINGRKKIIGCSMQTTLFRFTTNRAAQLLLAGILFGASVAVPSGSVSAQSNGSQKKRAAGAEPNAVAESRRMRILPFRLRPGQDLRQQIEAIVKAGNIKAGFILTAVGSLRSAALRLADQKEATTFAGKFEIVSLVGTMGQDGVHLHLSISDSSGRTIGGHLVEGCQVYTTVEIVIGEARGLAFTRVQDEETGYKELKIRSRKQK